MNFTICDILGLDKVFLVWYPVKHEVSNRPDEKGESMNIEIVYGFKPLTINSLGNRLNWNTYQQLFSTDKKEKNKNGKENNKKNP